MIITVVFSLHPLLQDYYGHVFLKGVCFAREYGWPVFAQKEIYEIDTYPQWLKETLFSEEAARAAQHIPFKRHYLQQCACEIFPEDIIDRYMRSYPSRTDAQMASMSQPWPEMTAYVVKRVKEIENVREEKIEAFMMQTAPRFIQDAAKELGVCVIDYEWSAFRSPEYQTTARIDFKGSVGDGELVERYCAFCDMEEMVPILSKREILALMLNDGYLERCWEEDIEPKYEAGIALGYSIPHVFTAYNQCSSIEMVKKAQDKFGEDEICVRYHPSDPVHARIYGVKEEEGSLYDFIRMCKRIVCCTSNIAYEAMLYNRPSYEMGWSQMAVYANKSLDELQDTIAEDYFLSFVAFGYYAPIELLNSIEYLRWRLTKPSEKEIYEYHLHYILNCRGLDEEILNNTKDRLNQIIEKRCPRVGYIVDMLDKPIWMKTDHASQLMIQLHRMEAFSESQKLVIQRKDYALNQNNETINRLKEELLIANEMTDRLNEALRREKLALLANQNYLKTVLETKAYRWSRKIADYVNRLLRRN